MDGEAGGETLFKGEVSVYGETVLTCASCDTKDAIWSVIIPGRHMMWCKHMIDTHTETLRADGAMFYQVTSC